MPLSRRTLVSVLLAVGAMAALLCAGLACHPGQRKDWASVLDFALRIAAGNNPSELRDLNTVISSSKSSWWFIALWVSYFFFWLTIPATFGLAIGYAYSKAVIAVLSRREWAADRFSAAFLEAGMSELEAKDLARKVADGLGHE